MQSSICLLFAAPAAQDCFPRALPVFESGCANTVCHVHAYKENEINSTWIKFCRPPLPFTSCWKLKYFPLCFISLVLFCLTHLLMSSTTVCVTAICSHGNDSCSCAHGIRLLALHFLHNLGAVRALPQCTHLSVLSKLMSFFLPASGTLHTLTYS